MFVKLFIAALVVAVAVSVAARSPGAAGPGRVHLVKPGDTLWSIATKYYAGDPREGVWRLQERNNVGGTTIRPGERIVVP